MSDHEDDEDVDPSELEQNIICFSCIGESYLSAEVARDGVAQACSYCDKTAQTITIGELADRVDRAFEAHYYQTSTEPEGIEYAFAKEGLWERHGEPVTWVIADASHIDEEPADHVRRVLEERHFDFDDTAAGEENPYDVEAHYKEGRVNDNELQAAWLNFEESLKSRSRFFNPIAQSTLESIFEELAAHRTLDGRSPIVDAGPGCAIAGIYRARVFQSDEKLEAAIKRPDIELGPPPSRLATAGRMNARGIGVFYGATDAEVALAETRPPVGSKAAVARFEIVRPLRLLDIEAFRSVNVVGSIFDSGHVRRLEKAKFLRTMSHLIAEPVMPDDEPFEYLVTQAIADYLAGMSDPALDGIIYPSVQTGGARWNSGLAGARRNIALFHKASRVAQLDIPQGTELTANLFTIEEDGGYPEYGVWEETPPAEPARELADTDDPPFFAFPEPTPVRGDLLSDARDVTLRLDTASVAVHHVEAVDYRTTVFPVRRLRWAKREEKF